MSSSTPTSSSYSIAEDVHKTRVAELLLQQGGRISVQVLNEFVAVARRKLRLTWDRIELELTAFRALIGEPLPLTLEVHTAAVRLARDHQINIYDANVLAAAQLAGCRVLYTEDLQDGRCFGELTVTNPFAP